MQGIRAFVGAAMAPLVSLRGAEGSIDQRPRGENPSVFSRDRWARLTTQVQLVASAAWRATQGRDIYFDRSHPKIRVPKNLEGQVRAANWGAINRSGVKVLQVTDTMLLIHDVTELIKKIQAESQRPLRVRSYKDTKENWRKRVEAMQERLKSTISDYRQQLSDSGDKGIDHWLRLGYQISLEIMWLETISTELDDEFNGLFSGKRSVQRLMMRVGN